MRYRHRGCARWGTSPDQSPAVAAACQVRWKDGRGGPFDAPIVRDFGVFKVAAVDDKRRPLHQDLATSSSLIYRRCEEVFGPASNH